SLRAVLCPFCVLKTRASPEIYTLSLHDALPILPLDDFKSAARHRERPRFEQQTGLKGYRRVAARVVPRAGRRGGVVRGRNGAARSEEHTSELQSRGHLVCRLLLEKKKKPVRDRR